MQTMLRSDQWKPATFLYFGVSLSNRYLKYFTSGTLYIRIDVNWFQNKSMKFSCFSRYASYSFTPCHSISYCFILLHTVSYCFVRWVELKTTRKQHVYRSTIMNADRIPASFGFFLKPGFGWTRYSRLVLSQAHLRRHTVQKSYLELLRKTRQQWSQSPGENVDTLPQSIPKRPWAWSTSWSCFRWVRVHAFLFFSSKLPDQ